MTTRVTRRDVVMFIVGPTAIGKTRLSIKLARKINGEIVSADSMQIYKGMRILSQAPTDSERKKVRHYLVGKLDPRNEYSVAAFIENASSIINSISKLKKTPIIVGGGGLYIKALIDGLFPSPETDLKFRSSMERLALKYGSNKLHAKLLKIDPISAKNIHPNDTRRIIRALEIHHSTGQTMTELKKNTRGLKDQYKIKIFGLIRSRDEIYANIDRRVDKMFEDGIINEVKRLKDKKLSKTAKAALGFKEVSGYLKGMHDVNTAKSLLKKNTRNFAKRQLTWFRADKRIKWFDASRLKEDEIVRKIKAEIA